MKNLEKLLIKYFKDVLKEHHLDSFATDYPSMHAYLLPISGLEYSVLYNTLTHKTVPELERKNILTRRKLTSGRYIFIVDFRKPKK